MPGCLSCKNTAAFNEPSANMYFDVAVCFISIFRHCRKDYRVLADNGAASYRMYTYFFFVSLFSSGMPVINILMLFTQNGIYCIGYGQCGSAGSINFLVVVLFDDFYVKIAFKHFCRFFTRSSMRLHLLTYWLSKIWVCSLTPHGAFLPGSC